MTIALDKWSKMFIDTPYDEISWEVSKVLKILSKIENNILDSKNIEKDDIKVLIHYWINLPAVSPKDKFKMAIINDMRQLLIKIREKIMNNTIKILKNGDFEVVPEKKDEQKDVSIAINTLNFKNTVMSEPNKKVEK